MIPPPPPHLDWICSFRLPPLPLNSFSFLYCWEGLESSLDSSFSRSGVGNTSAFSSLCASFFTFIFSKRLHSLADERAFEFYACFLSPLFLFYGSSAGPLQGVQGRLRFPSCGPTFSLYRNGTFHPPFFLSTFFWSSLPISPLPVLSLMFRSFSFLPLQSPPESTCFFSWNKYELYFTQKNMTNSRLR